MVPLLLFGASVSHTVCLPNTQALLRKLISHIQERDDAKFRGLLPSGSRSALAPFLSPACMVPDCLPGPCFLHSIELSPIVTLAKGELGGWQATRISLPLF